MLKNIEVHMGVMSQYTHLLIHTLILFLLQVVFERIMLEPDDITAQLRVTRETKHDTKAAVAAGENDELIYLCHCYTRCWQLQQEFKVR